MFIVKYVFFLPLLNPVFHIKYHCFILVTSVSFLLIPHRSLAKSLISADRDGLHVSSQTF